MARIDLEGSVVLVVEFWVDWMTIRVLQDGMIQHWVPLDESQSRF
jgi:hypothetical protein